MRKFKVVFTVEIEAEDATSAISGAIDAVEGFPPHKEIVVVKVEVTDAA